MREKLLNAIRAHAAAEYPRECCGLIVAVGRRQAYRACRNLARDPAEHFALDPKDYAAAEDAGDVLAIVHSHPDATSRPSEHDKAMCDLSGMPWYILSWPEGDLRYLEPRHGRRPLVGRPYVYGALDCYSLVQDWYQAERGVDLARFPTEDRWWEQGDQDVLMESFRAVGFAEVAEPAHGDVILMQVGAPVTNHCAIYLGDNMMLHHMPGKLSGREVYGGYWRERTRLYLRYQD